MKTVIFALVFSLLVATSLQAKLFFLQHGAQGPFTTPPPTLAISLSPSAVTDPATTPTGANLSFITVTVSDHSPFTGTVAFGGANGDGGGVCVLLGVSTTLAAPTANTLVDSDGTWGFGSGPPSSFGYQVLLNGVSAGGDAVLLLSYNGHTYVETSPTAGWYLWTGSTFSLIAGDPRTPGSAALALAKVLTAGTYNCSIVATQ